MTYTYITNGKIVLPDSVLLGKALAFDTENGKIIGVTDRVPTGADCINAEGNYIAPGLVDLHIHGYLNEDASDGNAAGLKKIACGIIKNGVTAFLPTTITTSKPTLLAAFDTARSLKAESRCWDGAEILGVHAEGPFINPDKKGAHQGEYILPPDADFLLAHADIISLVTLAPEMDRNHACIKRLAAESDMLISMGHTNADFDEIMSAIHDGAHHVTHLFNTMSPLTHRSPGAVGAALAAKDVSVEVIADTLHIHPALYSILAKLKGNKMILVTDCVRAGGMPDGTYTLGGQPICLQGIACRLADGTVAGSVLQLNRAVKNVLDHTDLPVHTVFHMASLNPATAIGRADRIGSLETGKDADIIIADDGINIIRTVKKGKTVYLA